MVIRVRFAPSPTGHLHLGNIRIALFNCLFARQKKGTFILRIEDTDIERNVPEAIEAIISDLKWLGLTYDEGPFHEGEYAPYFQSQRGALYQEKLDELISQQKVYRCFCTPEQLEAMRSRQRAMKKPPRYDRTCLHLSDDMIKQKLANGTPFIWRLQLNYDALVSIFGMARGEQQYELKNFSDPALTRSDGSFTFMFTNFTDDWLMNITHVIRGEDHLTNSALQAALFEAFAVPLPKFWHLPFLCDAQGKKLSKRDPHFSLGDLRTAGFLPEAILNYLAVIGSTFTQEVQSIEELITSYDFESLHATGSIRFDEEKLRWFNHEWINRLSLKELAHRIRPVLEKAYPQAKKVNDQTLEFLLSKIRTDLYTLTQVPLLLEFYFESPKRDLSVLAEHIGKENIEKILALIAVHEDKISEVDMFMQALGADAKTASIPPRILWSTVRYLLTGSIDGLRIHDLFEMLGQEDVSKRLR